MFKTFKTIASISVASLLITGCGNNPKRGIKITFDAAEGEFSDGSHTKTVYVRMYGKLKAPETPVRTGYTCSNKWYRGEQEWDFSRYCFSESMTLTTDWLVNSYTLSVTSDDTSKGTVSGSGTYTYDSSVTVTATPVEHHAFLGWYNESNKVSSDATYTFNMPANDYSLEAKFKLDTVVYGLYPQTHVSDETLISALDSLTTSSVNENGYYSYNENLYYPYVANPDDSSFTFEDGVSIVSGNKYWFKVEPIEWKILNEEEGFVTSTRILDMHLFNERYKGTPTKTDYQGNTGEAYANNYKYSDLRSWLNTDFYNAAFSNDDTRIKTTEVDNAASTTAHPINDYVCENTNDKIFLLSYQELLDDVLNIVLSILLV
mgnify:FL=1